MRARGFDYERYGEPRLYRIIRFRYNGTSRTLRNGLTLTEAQAHCARPDTSSHSTGPGAWFDGFDYMRGCRPHPEDVRLSRDTRKEAL